MKYTINKILVTLSISTIATGDLMVIMRGVGEIFWTLGPAQCLKKVSGNPLMLFSLCIMEYLRHECINYNHDPVIILGLRDKHRGCCDVGKKAAGRGISKFSIFSVHF